MYLVEFICETFIQNIWFKKALKDMWDLNGQKAEKKDFLDRKIMWKDSEGKQIILDKNGRR